MPKRGAVALVTTILAVLLLFGFQTGGQSAFVPGGPTAGVIGTPGRTQPGPVAAGATPSPTPTSVGGGPGATPPATRPSAPGSGTFTGDTIRTPYGDVQVAVVMEGSKIVDVQSLKLPFDRRLSQQISQVAGPLLRTQVLKAQSANIRGVSGASYTSEGYFESLQSALAKAH